MRPETNLAVKDAAKSIGLPYATLRSIIEVEARSSGFKNGKLQILYEPHVAWRELGRTNTAKSRQQRNLLGKEKLAYSRWGARPYPKSIAARHEQLQRAVEIAGPQAYRWISMGLPQGMGFNHEAFGYPTAKVMFDEFVQKGEIEQVYAMARFIKANPGMLRAAQRRDWNEFARRYNGEGYRKNNYHKKLARAYARFRNGVPVDPWADGYLSQGDKGKAVRELQQFLTKAGFDLGSIDADFGSLTEEALTRWQSAEGREPTGQMSLDAFREHVTKVTGQPAKPGDPHPAPPAPKRKPTKEVVQEWTVGGGILTAIASALYWFFGG